MIRDGVNFWCMKCSDLIALKIKKKKNRNNEENKKGISEQNSAQNIKKYWSFDDWFYLLKKIFHW